MPSLSRFYHSDIMTTNALRLLTSFVDNNVTANFDRPLSTVWASMMARHKDQSQTVMVQAHADWYWSQIIVRLLSTLLRFAGYPPAALTKLCNFVDQVISPAMGAAPSLDARGRTVPTFDSYMCDDYTPIELSMMWGRHKSWVRFSIEAISSRGEMARALGLNVAASMRLMTTLESKQLADFALFRKLMASTTVCRLSESEAAATTARSVARSQIFFGFDLLQNGDIMVKGYLIPLLRSHLSQCSAFDLIHRAILDNGLGCRALEAVRQYVQGEAHGSDKGLPESARPEAIILSTDALAERQAARLKIYFRFPTSSFEEILRHLSLGGRTCRLPWIEPLRRCWLALMQTDPYEISADTDAPRAIETSTAGCLIYYSFFQGAELPTAKLYIPVRHWCRDDLSIARAVGNLIHSFSGDDATANAGLYSTLLGDCYPGASLGSSKGRQTYLCLGRKDDGSFELSIYLNPFVFGAEPTA